MDKTIKILKIALEANPENWETRRHLAEMLAENGAGDEALILLKDAPEIPSTDDDELFVAEQFLASEPSKAAPHIDRVLKRNKGSAHAHWLKAQVFQSLGLSEDARKHYTTATVLDDQYVSSEFEGMLGDAPESVSAPIAEAVAVEEEVTPVVEEVPDVEEAPQAVEESAPVVSAGAASSQRLATPLVAKQTDAAPPVPQEAPAPSLTAAAASAPVNDLSNQMLADRMEATQAQAKKKNKAVAVFVAGLIHAAVILACLLWYLNAGPLPEPSVVMQMKAPEDQQERIDKKAIAQNLPQRPSSSSASRARVIAANATSPIAVPEVEIEVITDEIIGAGDSFGMGSGWGDGDGSGGGGTVRFFSEEKKARRVLYILDYSTSMMSPNSEGNSRIQVLKDELKESIKGLDPSMRYTVVFFSGMAWLQDENPNNNAVIGRMGMQDVELEVTWYDASKKNKEETFSKVDSMSLAPSNTGTLWMSGIKPSMKISPKPDQVFFLTDGECQDYIRMGANSSYDEFFNEFVTNTKAWEGFLEQMLEVIPSGLPINTVSMEMPGTAAARLAELASKTGGSFSIVKDGRTYKGKAAQKFTREKYNPM